MEPTLLATFDDLGLGGWTESLTAIMRIVLRPQGADLLLDYEDDKDFVPITTPVFGTFNQHFALPINWSVETRIESVSDYVYRKLFVNNFTSSS